MKHTLVYGYLIKRYKITLGEAAKFWALHQPEPTENIRIDNVGQLSDYLDGLEKLGEPIETKKEETTMAKDNGKDEVKGLLEKYNGTEDSAEKAKLRRQLRKKGYYLSKQGGDTPAKPEEKKTDRKGRETPPPLPEQTIMVGIYINGELVQRDIVPFKREIRVDIQSN